MAVKAATESAPTLAPLLGPVQPAWAAWRKRRKYRGRRVTPYGWRPRRRYHQAVKVFLVYPSLNQCPSYSCGVGYIAAVLAEDGHEVFYQQVCDQNDATRLLQRIEDEQPRLIGFSATTGQFGHLKELIARVRRVSQATLVCGGIHPTVKPDCLLETPGLDAIIRGEGEYPMRELADALEHQSNSAGIANLWLRRNGVVHRNDFRPLITDLDSLPFPYRDDSYQSVVDQSLGMHRMIFSRGCPFGCPYCSHDALIQLVKGKGKYHRSRSPEKALEEIARDAQRFRFRFIFFDDDTITLDHDWCLDFFGRYQRTFAYPFYCNVHPRTVNATVIRALAEAGCKGIALGIEHGNEQFRKKVLRRNLSNARIQDAVQLCRDHGIREIYGQIMIGLPFENLRLCLDSIRFCRQLGVIPFRYIYQPYPSTELARVCEQNQWLPTTESYVERREAVIDFPDFSRRDIQLCFDVFNLLVRVPFLPLRLPFVPTTRLLKLYRALTARLLRWLRALYNRGHLLRRWILVRPAA